MKVFVTGGAGYIGSVCVEELLQAKYDVTVFDNLREGHRADLESAWRWLQAHPKGYA